MQFAAPLALKRPAAQGWHTPKLTAPEAELFVPAGQGAQEVWVAFGWYVPALLRLSQKGALGLCRSALLVGRLGHAQKLTRRGCSLTSLRPR